MSSNVSNGCFVYKLSSSIVCLLLSIVCWHIKIIAYNSTVYMHFCTNKKFKNGITFAYILLI